MPSAAWSLQPMVQVSEPGGPPYWKAEATFIPDATGATLDWGVQTDGPAGAGVWGIAAEVDDVASTDRTLSFTLQDNTGPQRYFLTWCGLLGTNRVSSDTGLTDAARFSVWAPNAQSVSLILADPSTGYVADDGTGIVQTIAMTKGSDGIWSTHAPATQRRNSLRAMLGQTYMFKVVKDDGSSAYRTDLWSLMQIGAGDFDPKGSRYAGPPEQLDGPQSCSVVCDPSVVVLAGVPEVPASGFWSGEFVPGRPMPASIDDLVIYELHVGALGFGRAGPGTLDDATDFLNHLDTLGVNAVELLPIAEFETAANWGYGTSHFFAIDQAAGGTDRLKAFVKACHRRGIAVILDVCYNHFTPDAERAQWAYDSNDPTRNIYYWYEGQPGDYAKPDGGYIDNLSSGWAPRFDQEAVRQLFISSAAFLVSVCHVDGFRLDQTSSIHQYPVVHATQRRADRAAAFGVKFLRQWTRTMRLVAPRLFLCAEDYSGWSAMTEPSLTGTGMGFDATWYADFHHNLVEFNGGGYAELLKEAGYGDDRLLQMDRFADTLRASGTLKIVYHESHDDVGNREGSARTIVTAVNHAPLIGETRKWAEARVRYATAMSLLSAATPMFFMGEEVGAAKPYRYNDFLDNREDIRGLAAGDGAKLFAFYRQIVNFSVSRDAIRSRNIFVSVVDDASRVLAFYRWNDDEAYLVVGSLNNRPFVPGYVLHDDRLVNFVWREVFNSDSLDFGGWNVGNAGAALQADNGALRVTIPACGVIVFRRS
ncbi:alpha-amylase family glycosyl hydrolase [Paraburkholderia sp. BL6669N2]|uniref:alpha-amylase family glycosyl hydrolase n=1 Tax=Paraburkholderia sp. BL6669N2 TaxID=1938807 RepID=UPI001C6EBC00|nr:alpha-amylase family glycosyl hydrolase [Paraburkholderia sp. BL6669N2]